jgi:cytochrome d ubiquinol oxidase subunit II
VNLAYVMAGVLLLAVTAYSTAGGVDFGAGIWDLLAGQDERGRRARDLIDHSMAPVWEVNNVWLVLAIVVCWTGFPLLFEQVFLYLYPLYAAALIGLILRGAFFAFRHVAESPRTHRIADLVFGVSSVVTPFFFAMTLGAIASGRVGAPGVSVWDACVSPMSVMFGVVSVAATSLSGASFLVGDARRRGPEEMVEYFRTRVLVAVGALIVTGTVALVAIAFERRELLNGMLSFPAVVLVLAVMVLTPAVGFLVWRRIFRWYRVLTVAAVGSMVVAWGFAQSPYLLPERLTIAQASAPGSTQTLLVVIALGVLLVIGPSIGLLLYLDQRNALEPEG